MTAIGGTLANLLLVVAVGVLARVIANRLQTVSFTILLVFAGLLVSLLDLKVGVPLSRDLIFLLILPPILFSGGLQLNYSRLRRDAPLIGLLLLVGLPLAVLGMGYVGQFLFPYPLVVTLLLAAMIYPLDPVAILTVFESMEAPDRLLTIIEGEPLFDDGLAVVFFLTFLQLFRTTVQTGKPLAALLTVEKMTSILMEFFIVSVGGVVVGVVFGAVGVGISRFIAHDELTDLLLSAVVAFGSTLVAEEYLHVSGILAAVAAGITVGYTSSRYLSTEGLETVRRSWKETEILIDTGVFMLIGTHTRIPQLVEFSDLILIAAVLFLVMRAVVVYGLSWVANRWYQTRGNRDQVPRSYQHVLVWGGLHTVVPIAVALSLPSDLPYTGELRTIVFGVAIVSIVGQGLTVPYLLRYLDVGGGSSE